ncbi:MAG: glycosyltransferase [Nitrospira sp.]|nr:glycosyltransferase [Nitrospira sp.]
MAEDDVLKRLWRYLQRYQLYLWGREVIGAIRGVWPQFRGGVVSLHAVGSSRGRVLISYDNQGLLSKMLGEPIPTSHPQFLKTILMAQTFVDLGYDVDVIHCENQKFVPWKPYDIIVDTRMNLQRLQPYLPSTCIKILHCDTAQIVYQNSAEMGRMLAFQQRKGRTVPPNRLEAPHLGVEHADYLTTCGNEFTVNTYTYSNKPMFRLPMVVQQMWPWPESKYFDVARHRFLWFGSRGMVHKGLDLVLEAFVRLPDCQLTIVGPVHNEPEFVDVYRKELFHTPNIKCVGWLDKSSEEFRLILEQSIAHVFPSCSEAGAAAVIESMAAGVIPVASYESSIDVENFGFLLEDVSIETIMRQVSEIAEMSVDELSRRAKKAWEAAHNNHTPEKFSRSFRATVEMILAKHGRR